MEQFADLWQCHGYVECSALTGDNVKETLDYILRKGMNHRQELLSKGSKRIVLFRRLIESLSFDHIPFVC